MNIKIELKTFLLVGFCFSSCLFFSCKDDNGELGSEFQNPDENVLVYNDSSMNINAYTAERHDFIKLGPSYFLLGYLNDPELGSFENGFMTELNQNNFEITGTAKVDSLVFHLSYMLDSLYVDNYPFIYGDPTHPQLINIYELNKDNSLIGIDSMPNTDATINTYVNKERVGLAKFYPNVKDTVLRIKLPNTLGERLLENYNYSDSSSEAFNRDVFRGLYFKPQPISGTGAISAFTIADSTRLQLYYTENDTARSTSYYIIGSTLRCNTFKRTYKKDLKILPFETKPSEEDEGDNFYLKNNNGLESIVEISGLQTWADSGYFTINKALITFETEHKTVEDSIFKPINEIIIEYPKDLDLESRTDPTYLGEYGLTPIKYIENVGYTINIKNTIYSAIKAGKDKVSLILTTGSGQNKSAATRTVFKGANNKENPLKLHITYTKFNVE